MQNFDSQKLMQSLFQIRTNRKFITPNDLEQLLPFCSSDLSVTSFLALLNLYEIIRAFPPRSLSSDACLLRRFLYLSIRKRHSLSSAIIKDLVKSAPGVYFPIKSSLLLSSGSGSNHYRDIEIVIERRTLLEAVSALSHLGFVPGNICSDNPDCFVAYNYGDFSFYLQNDRDNPSYELRFIAHHDWPDKQFENAWRAIRDPFDFIEEREFYVLNGDQLLTRTLLTIIFSEHQIAYHCLGTQDEQYLIHMAGYFKRGISLSGMVSPNQLLDCAVKLASPTLRNKKKYLQLFKPILNFSSSGRLQFANCTRKCLDGFMEDKRRVIESRF